MAVQPIVIPKEREEKGPDPLDQLLRGLQLANGVFGIVANLGSIDAAKQNRELNDQQRELNKVKILEAQRESNAKAAGVEAVDYNKYEELPGPVRPEGGKVIKKVTGYEGENPIIQEAYIMPKREKKSILLKDAEWLDPKTGTTYAATFNPETGEYKKTDVVLKLKPEKASGLSEKDLREGYVEYQKSFNKSAAPVKDAISASDSIFTIAKSGQKNPVAAAALPAKLARAAGETGVLTDADMARYGGSQALADSFTRWANKAANGTLNGQDAADAIEFANLLKTRSQQRLDQIADETVDQFTSIYGGDAKTNFNKIIGAGYKRGKQEGGDSGNKSALGNKPSGPLAPGVSDEQKNLVTWAYENPNDPRSAEVLKKLGIKPPQQFQNAGYSNAPNFGSLGVK